MSSERVITVGVTTVGVVVAVTVVLVVFVAVVGVLVVGVVTDCSTAMVTVAVLQIGFRLLSFEV